MPVFRYDTASNTFTPGTTADMPPQGDDAKCGVACHTIAKNKDYVFTELKRRGYGIPIVFITAHNDEAVRARLIEQGAVACLLKPFSDTALRDAVAAALGSKAG